MAKGRLKQKIVAGIFFWLASATVLAADIPKTVTWDEKYFSRAPLPDDLILPMPCGGAMVFRRVETPNTEGALGDVAVTLGAEGGTEPFRTGLRRSYVSGAFSEGKGNEAKEYFYMAKYEVSQAQWDAVLGKCPKEKQRRKELSPAVGKTKLDFERFAQTYTLWLMKQESTGDNAIYLPRVGNTQGYVRLPTEPEWEFAARGGLAIDQAQFRAPYPPILEGESLNQYIAHGGSDSANGKLQLIGTRKANPLGIHDMIGNASEIVSSPFSLVRHGRLHGQAGGFVKRGGNARTPLAGQNSATRFEVVPFDVKSGTATTDRFTGARMAISGLAITSKGQIDRLNKALKDMAKPDSALGSAASEEEAIELLQQLALEVDSVRIKTALALVSDTIQRGQAERNVQRDRSIRLVLTSAVLSCDQTILRYMNVLAISELLKTLDEIEDEARATNDTDLLDELARERPLAEENLRELVEKVKRQVLEYANFAEGLAADYSQELLSKQIQYATEAILKQGARRGTCLALLETHLQARSRKGFLDIDLVKKDFRQIALTESKP